MFYHLTFSRRVPGHPGVTFQRREPEPKTEAISRARVDDLFWTHETDPFLGKICGIDSRPWFGHERWNNRFFKRPVSPFVAGLVALCAITSRAASNHVTELRLAASASGRYVIQCERLKAEFFAAILASKRIANVDSRTRKPNRTSLSSPIVTLEPHNRRPLPHNGCPADFLIVFHEHVGGSLPTHFHGLGPVQYLDGHVVGR